MHLTLIGIVAILAYWKSDWRNWQKYGLTIYYVTTCNLLYGVLCQNHLLWKYVPDLLPNSNVLVDIFYSFIVLPCVTLLYLSNYPFGEKVIKHLVYITAWVIGSFLIFYPFVQTGRLVLQNGYHYWMDFFFYIVMYGLIRLHYSRPILTYGISIIFIVFLMRYFHVSIH